MEAVQPVALDKITSPNLPVQDRMGKYLIFQFDKEEFGIKVLNVREIMGMQEITAVPQTQAGEKRNGHGGSGLQGMFLA